MIATSMNITGITIEAAIDDAALTVCGGCNVAVPMMGKVCEYCD